MQPILCFPDPPSPELQKALAISGYPWSAVSDTAAVARTEPAEGFSCAVVSAVESPERALAFARVIRERETNALPVLLVVESSALRMLERERDLFDDFALEASLLDELDARLAHLLWRTGRTKNAEVIVYGPLALNLETYQAVVGGRPLDLTYMEYELLRYLAAHPGKVFTREALLSAVWGYDYFGGARTVDVHVRRLRAKLGEENAHLIETVRSVGYRFGTSRWTP
ncbi:MAG: response regulator transcription factor [Acidimicrobiales bacterium]